ncbi:protein peste-like [Uranotaenia lowii]|uniref:protein peste-like n=1 Tax=Uranotaenia lowii TaxID=190385 RepID=UPI002479C498|nr:protein peste-like [Uranotaenia lowii]
MRINKFYCVASLGVILALVGAFFAIFWGHILDAIVIKEKAINPTSNAFKMWRRPPFHPTWEITLFNWTNAEDFIQSRARKPAFSEVGPFVYSESTEKVDIRFNTKNGTVSFRRRSTFTLDKRRTHASLDEPVTNINVVSLSAANRAHYWGYAAQRGISFALFTYRQGVVVTKTASELMFEGYPEPMIDRATEIMKFIGEEIPFEGRFSWFHTINASKKAYGVFNMDIGKDDSSKYGMIKAWNYKTQAPFADGECGKFRGFNGEIFPTKLRKDQPLKIFTPEMCRMVSFEFEQEEDVHGVIGYRFVGNARTVDNGSLYAENQCNHGGEFMPSGLINITECRLGAPFYISFPHFYQADPFYKSHVQGMNPDKERHQFFITIEPTTGIVLRASAKFQINLLLQPYSAIALYQDVQRSYIPVLWFSRSFDLSREEVHKLKGLINVADLGYIGGFAVAVIGLLMTFLAIGLSFAFKSSQRKQVQHQQNPTQNGGDSRGDYQPVQNGTGSKGPKDRIQM